jgi:hypothetical protein
MLITPDSISPRVYIIKISILSMDEDSFPVRKKEDTRITLVPSVGANQS